jgi:hypothetical protein
MYQLDEEPPRCSGVEKGNQMPPGPGARSLVDELQTLRLQPNQGFQEVGNPVCDVMKARTSPLKETAYRSFGAQRLDELHGAYEKDSDTLSREFLHRGRGIS